jgi:chitinase
MNCRKETRPGRKANPRVFSVIILACILFIVGQSVCFASSVTLQWGSSAGASGYKVYYQANSSTQPFASSVDAQNQTNATISGLDKTRSYYFAVVAYNSSKVESSYSNIVAIHPLSASFSGNGAGNINSNPSGISCVSGTCTVQFSRGSTITLLATPSSNSTSLSYFSAWNGCTSTASNSCTIVINAAKNVTATFTTLNPVRISGGNYYSTLQTAYNAAGNSKILTQAVNLTGNLTTSSNKAITLEGGYNATYLGRSGNTVMQGTLTVSKGSLIVDNLVIR